MKKFEDGGLLISRVLLSVLFIVAGYGKITGYAGTAAYMASMHVPSFFLPVLPVKPRPPGRGVSQNIT